MENTKFKVGDWIIDSSAQKPKAYQLESIETKGYLLLNHKDKGWFAHDNKGVRLAYQSEIPKEFRIKNYLFY